MNKILFTLFMALVLTVSPAFAFLDDNSTNQDQNSSQGVTVEGDKENTYVMTAPNTVAGEGQSAMAAYSIFGGFNVAESDEYKVAIEVIRTVSQMAAAGLITKEEAREEALIALKQLKDATRPKRVLGFLWKTRGRHLGNLLGLLSMDDGYTAVDKWIPESLKD